MFYVHNRNLLLKRQSHEIFKSLFSSNISVLVRISCPKGFSHVFKFAQTFGRIGLSDVNDTIVYCKFFGYPAFFKLLLERVCEYRYFCLDLVWIFLSRKRKPLKLFKMTQRRQWHCQVLTHWCQAHLSLTLHCQQYAQFWLGSETTTPLIFDSALLTSWQCHKIPPVHFFKQG